MPKKELTKKEAEKGYCLTCDKEVQPTMLCKCAWRTNYIDECLEEFGNIINQHNKIDINRISYSLCEDIETFLKQKLQQVEEHETENGYCCACEYDIACMNEKIEIAIQKKVDEIKKSKTKIVGILFNAQNSPIEYSLQEIADKIIKIIKN